MQEKIILVYLVFGIGLGALLCYLLIKGRLQSQYNQDISQREAEDAVLRRDCRVGRTISWN